MKVSYLLLVIFVALSAGYVGSKLAVDNNIIIHQKETAYERVMRTQTIRCGYNEWDGAVLKDPITGEFSGAVVDILEAMGKASNLKIEWTQQVNWGDVVAALKSNKIDAMCAGMWTSALKAKDLGFTTPFAYQGIEAFVRADDKRFDDGLKTINNPATKIAVIDGDNSTFIAEDDFPQAQRVALGQLNSADTDLMLHVISGKADVSFTVLGLFHQFEKSNPGKLRRLMPNHYLRVFGLSPIVVDNEDLRLKVMLDAAVEEVRNSGHIDRILDKADLKYPDMFVRTQKPY